MLISFPSTIRLKGSVGMCITLDTPTLGATTDGKCFMSSPSDKNQNALQKSISAFCEILTILLAFSSGSVKYRVEVINELVALEIIEPK